jgi:hypothetical protein
MIPEATANALIVMADMSALFYHALRARKLPRLTCSFLVVALLIAQMMTASKTTVQMMPFGKVGEAA